MTHPTLIDIAWNTITHAHGDGQFALACLALALLVGVYLLFRSIIRLAYLTIDDIDAAEGQGEC